MTDRAANEPDNEREEFNRIVAGTEWNFEAVASAESTPDADETPSPPIGPADDSQRSPSVDEEFYRRVDPVARPWRRGPVLAWLAVLGSPVLLVLASLSSWYMSRPFMAVIAIGFLAGASFLITNLPQHGPGDDDYPDDGAVL